MSKRSGVLVAVAVSLCLQACGTTPMRSQDSVPVAAAVNAAAGFWIDPGRVSVAPVEWQGAVDGVTAQERAALSERFRQSLSVAVHSLPAVADGRPAELHAFISDVNTVSPALNLLSAAVLLLPFDGGGATVRFEAVDPSTGERLLSREYTYNVPMTAVRARFHRMAPANAAVDNAAGVFAAAVRDTPVPAPGEIGHALTAANQPVGE